MNDKILITILIIVLVILMSILLISSCAKRDVSDYNNMYGGAYVMKIRHPFPDIYLKLV